MSCLSYHINSSIVLSNECFTNAGLTRDEMKERIQKVRGVTHCKDWCINHNIEVMLNSDGARNVTEVFLDIEEALFELLEIKGINPDDHFLQYSVYCY